MTDHDPRDLPSILEVIDARAGDAPRVQLREDDVAPPELSEVTLQKRGRYRILGQIAEGGVGQIFKGLDADLNRDVALKMLRENHVENTDLIRRFVEEAQIGGQMQHPGIVPVYEIGLGEDRRPYFSMKLVKGRTLAALLADRANPGEDRRRYIDVFLKICETMAYAHCRGVIHRDLKTSNVMIGAFGEVQVVDWGFAKVLAQGGVADERRARREAIDVTRIATVRSGSEGSESVAGAVMGTPAYMPPEQALGLVDDLDERTDVFALGAILCEILTGKPPYLGTPNDRLSQAADGKIESAVERLRICGAEPGLARLAEKCLAPLRADRPRDAGTVARSLARFLTAAEMRAKRGKIAALEAREEAARAAAETAEERARAEEARTRAAKQRAKLERLRARAEKAREVAAEARRSRRRHFLIAAAVLLVVLVGAGVYLRIASGRVEHERQAALRADELLERARALKGARRWDEALAVLDRAADVARAGNDTRVRTLADAVRDDRREEEALRAREQANTTFATRLSSALLGDGDESALATAFRSAGLDPLRADAASSLDDREEIAPTIAAALDAWAVLRPRGEERDRLLGLARRADPDETRNRLRAAISVEEWSTLNDLLGEDETAPLPGPTAELLGDALLGRGAADPAAAFLRRARIRRPDRPRLAVLLARALMRQSIPIPSEACRLLGAARVLRPESPELRAYAERLAKSGSDLDAFRARTEFLDPSKWFHVDIDWSRITGRKRRIYAEKQAITAALMAYPDADEASPLVYPEGTAFVAESFDRQGKLFRTEAIRVRWPAERTEFMVFDREGNRTGRFRKNGPLAPRACANCHLARGSARGHFPPMMNFPEDPEEGRLDLDTEYRHEGIVLKFKEARLGGSSLFGPYAAMWLGILRADHLAGKMQPENRRFFDELWTKFRYVMDD